MAKAKDEDKQWVYVYCRHASGSDLKLFDTYKHPYNVGSHARVLQHRPWSGGGEIFGPPFLMLVDKDSSPWYTQWLFHKRVI